MRHCRTLVVVYSLARTSVTIDVAISRRRLRCERRRLADDCVDEVEECNNYAQQPSETTCCTDCDCLLGGCAVLSISARLGSNAISCGSALCRSTSALFLPVICIRLLYHPSRCCSLMGSVLAAATSKRAFVFAVDNSNGKLCKLFSTNQLNYATQLRLHTIPQH